MALRRQHMARVRKWAIIKQKFHSFLLGLFIYVLQNELCLLNYYLLLTYSNYFFIHIGT